MFGLISTQLSYLKSWGVYNRIMYFIDSFVFIKIEHFDLKRGVNTNMEELQFNGIKKILGILY